MSLGSRRKSWLRLVVRSRDGEAGIDTDESDTASGFGAWVLHASSLPFRRERMRFEPQCTGGDSRINADLLPPRRLVATAMDFAMMAAAERYGEFVANLSAKGPLLRKAQMMGIRGRTTANQTWLFGDEPYMLAISNSALFGVAKFTLVDVRGVSTSGHLMSFRLYGVGLPRRHFRIP